MDPKKFAGRKFLLTLISLGGYLIYNFLNAVPVDPIGLSVIIGTYGFLNVYQKKGNGDV